MVGFDRGYQITLEVPVVRNDGYHAGLDGPAPAEEPAAETEPESETE